MENAATARKRHGDETVEISPEPAETLDAQGVSHPSLTVKRPSYGVEPPDATKPQPAVKVFSYIGTPSDKIGTDGDFYLEEETNILYGPKANGTWPEDGVQVSGPVMRRKRKEAQRAWSMHVPKQSFATKIRNFLLGAWDALRKTYPIGLNLQAPAPSNRKRRPMG